jgi:hypothetical protein
MESMHVTSDGIFQPITGAVMKHIYMIAIIIMLFPSFIMAESISGTGYGQTAKEAKEEALGELSHNIKIEVRSEFKKVTTVKNARLDEFKTQSIYLKSDLPVIGAEFTTIPSNEGVTIEATLDFNRVRLYESELQKSSARINKNMEEYNKASANSEKAAFLKAILTDLDLFAKYRIVAELMRSKNIPENNITVAAIKAKLQLIEKKADTIDFGAKLIASGMVSKKIFIYPPAMENSNEITQFGSVVKDYLSKYLDTVQNPKDASFFMTGEYRLLKTGLELTCHLIDRQEKTIKTAIAFFEPPAYKDYKVEPASLSFEKLLNSGQIVSSDFKVDIKAEKGKRDLLYKKGDTMRLLVKMNRPGYFYLISHNLKDQKYSYVINFTEEPDNRKFVYYLSGDFVNKWLELGQFDVVAPFGVESIQMIASTQDLVDSIPDTFYDPSTRLFKIGAKSDTETSPQKALIATRGLIIKKEKAYAEAALVFTSMEQ